MCVGARSDESAAPLRVLFSELITSCWAANSRQTVRDSLLNIAKHLAAKEPGILSEEAVETKVRANRASMLVWRSRTRTDGDYVFLLLPRGQRLFSKSLMTWTTGRHLDHTGTCVWLERLDPFTRVLCRTESLTVRDNYIFWGLKQSLEMNPRSSC